MKMTETDLLVTRLQESELERARGAVETAVARAEKQAAVFDAHMMELYLKYEMRPHVDSFEKDGTIVRGEAK